MRVLWYNTLCDKTDGPLRVQKRGMNVYEGRRT